MLQNLRAELRPALHSFEHGVALNPSFAPGYAQIGNMLIQLGRFDEALDKIQYAIRLSPKDPALWFWARCAGWAELERGHDDAAFEWLFRAAALGRKSPLVHVTLAAAYALAGDRSDAERYALRYSELTPSLSNEQRLAYFSDASQRPRRLAAGARLALASPQ